MKNPNHRDELVSCCIGVLFLESGILKQKLGFKILRIP